MSNKKQIYIIGTTDFSFMVGEFIKLENQYSVIGYVVSANQYNDNVTRCAKKNVELFCLEDILTECGNKPIYILNTIGYTKMNSIREKISQLCRESGVCMVNFISKKALNYGLIKGTNNIIFPGAYVGSNVSIGDDNVIYAGVVLTHDIKVKNNNFIAANSTIGGNVVVNNNCFIGMGSTIRNSVNINNYTLIGAGCYVKCDTRVESVIVPSKSIELDKKSTEVVIGG